MHLSNFINCTVLGHLAYFQLVAITNTISDCIIVLVVALIVITSSTAMSILELLLDGTSLHVAFGCETMKGIMMS